MMLISDSEPVSVSRISLSNPVTEGPINTLIFIQYFISVNHRKDYEALQTDTHEPEEPGVDPQSI